jgi:uncharacterized protein YndB with AHSA1/START domain
MRVSMELKCKIEVAATRERIWPYYTDPTKRSIWEEDLESLTFDGEVKTGTTGKMKLRDMPEMSFTLIEVIPNVSYCDRTVVPGMGSLVFGHKILQESGKTSIEHSVRLEKESYTEQDAGFLCSVFADVPQSIMKIKQEVEG